MRTYFKIILSASCCAFIFNGCVSKTITITEVVDKNVSLSSKSWGKIVKADSSKKEDCVDCYATALVEPKKVVKSIEYSQNIETGDATKYYAAYDYVEPVEATNEYLAPVIMETNSAYGDYAFETREIAIQVGAFRNYSGAKRYKQKYRLLSSNYTVEIKTVQKENKPLYRVQIKGFKKQFEAKEFMDRYGISNAFLVRN